MKADDKFPSSKDFHALLSKPENKIRLQTCLQKEFQRLAATTGTEIIYCVVGSSARNLTTRDNMPEFSCFQAEADTAMFTVYSKLQLHGNTAPVVLDTEDTDCYVQAAYVVQMTPGILCLKHTHKLTDSRCLCSKAMSEFIIQLHVLTGCDHNSGFYGASKKLIANRLEKSNEARKLLSTCGTLLPITQKLLVIWRSLSFTLSMVMVRARPWEVRGL